MNEHNLTNHTKIQIGRNTTSTLEILDEQCNRIIKDTSVNNRFIPLEKARNVSYTGSTIVSNERKDISQNAEKDSSISVPRDIDASFKKEIAEIYPWVLHLAKKFCPSLKDAEDLAGDTICKILENKHKFRADKPLKPWCVAILRNTYLTMHNKKALIKFVSYESVFNISIPFNTSNDLYYNEILAAIKKCTKKTRCMECVILYAKGYSYDEISLLLNIPVGTVRSRISFGRKVLSKELEIINIPY